MTDSHPPHFDFQLMAKQIMLEHGFEPDFPAKVQQQLADIKARPPLAASSSKDVRDLRDMLWSSIDNDTSRDLDQIEVVESLPNGGTRIMVGIAEVKAAERRPRECVDEIAGPRRGAGAHQEE